MTNNLKLLKQLIDHIEDYEKDVGNDDIREFSVYLKDRTLGSPGTSVNRSEIQRDFDNYKSYAEIEFSTLLTGLFRFAKHYIKKALKSSSFNTVDEFGFLATLLREGSLLKTELINKHLLEISSGSEILKRLIKSGLIYDYPDENDKRAKRVALTEKGKAEILFAFRDMHKVSEIVIGNLSQAELSEALSALNKLTFFHNHIHEKDRNTSLDEIHHKYLTNDN